MNEVDAIRRSLRTTIADQYTDAHECIRNARVSLEEAQRCQTEVGRLWWGDVFTYLQRAKESRDRARLLRNHLNRIS